MEAAALAAAGGEALERVRQAADIRDAGARADSAKGEGEPRGLADTDDGHHANQPQQLGADEEAEAIVPPFGEPGHREGDELGEAQHQHHPPHELVGVLEVQT